MLPAEHQKAVQRAFEAAGYPSSNRVDYAFIEIVVKEAINRSSTRTRVSSFARLTRRSGMRYGRELLMPICDAAVNRRIFRPA